MLAQTRDKHIRMCLPCHVLRLRIHLYPVCGNIKNYVVIRNIQNCTFLKNLEHDDESSSSAADQWVDSKRLCVEWCHDNCQLCRFFRVCLRVTVGKPRRARWMGSDHARPRAISLCPRAKDDTLYLLHDCNLLPQFFLCARTGMKRTAAVFFDFQRVDIKHARIQGISYIFLALSEIDSLF